MSHTVLICDDVVYMRSLLRDILSRAGGYEIVGEAQTGVEAVEQYKALRPDLVTMDVVMPEKGGIDAVREIRSYDQNARILMCSALGQQSLVDEALEAGAMDFVLKPFDASRLLEAAQRALA